MGRFGRALADALKAAGRKPARTGGRKAGPDRLISKNDCGRYIHEFQGMIVADGECKVCHAKYLCWVDERNRNPIDNYRFKRSPDNSLPPEKQFFDLSYRSSFNDEPCGEDCGNPKLRSGTDIAAALARKDALLREANVLVRQASQLDPVPVDCALWANLTTRIEAEAGI